MTLEIAVSSANFHILLDGDSCQKDKLKGAEVIFGERYGLVIHCLIILYIGMVWLVYIVRVWLVYILWLF